MNAWDQAQALTLAFEGGYQCDHDDSGNWTGGEIGVGQLRGTNFGISAASYPNLDIRNLTQAEAAAIYFRDYWTAASCPKLPDRVAIAHFDAAVNCGLGAAAKLLQRAVGVLDDGQIGPETLAAVAARPELDVLQAMLWQRVRRYATIADPSGAWRGWILRTVKLREALA